jgi:hypothetical protein
LAQSQQNSDFASYYAELARLSYYIGAGEGRLDGLPQFSDGSLVKVDFAKKNYHADDALGDILRMQQALQEKLQNPPAGITDTPDFKTAVALALDVFNIAERYRGAFHEHIGADGKMVLFALQEEGRATGPGSALITEFDVFTPTTLTAKQMGDTKGDSMMNYDQLKDVAKDVVSNTNLNAPLVKQTFNDAIDLDAV